MEEQKFTEEQVVNILTFYVLQNGYFQPDVKGDLEIQYECARQLHKESGSHFELTEAMFGDERFEVEVSDVLTDSQWTVKAVTEEEAMWKALFRYVQGMDDFILNVIESYTA